MSSVLLHRNLLGDISPQHSPTQLRQTLETLSFNPEIVIQFSSDAFRCCPNLKITPLLQKKSSVTEEQRWKCHNICCSREVFKSLSGLTNLPGSWSVQTRISGGQWGHANQPILDELLAKENWNHGPDCSRHNFPVFILPSVVRLRLGIMRKAREGNGQGCVRETGERLLR